MDMTGEYRIPASRERVWAALNDPAVLRQAIPGCEAIDKSSDTEMTVKLTAKIGPVNARFAGKITLSDMDPPNGYTIFGEGTGGGFAKGGAEVTLTSDGAATILRYTAHASIGGKLARIGSRLVGGMARKMADEFFGKIAEIIAADPALVPIPRMGEGRSDGRGGRIAGTRRRADRIGRRRPRAAAGRLDPRPGGRRGAAALVVRRLIIPAAGCGRRSPAGASRDRPAPARWPHRATRPGPPSGSSRRPPDSAGAAPRCARRR